MVVTICQEMGWDYYQYLNQPKGFIELLRSKMEMDSDNLKRQMRKIKRR